MFVFEKQVYTHFRIRLTVGAILPIASVLFAGLMLRLQRRIYVGHTPITMGRDVTSMIGRSQSGNFLGRILIGEGRSSAIGQQNLKPGWYRASLDPFIEYSKTGTFFFAWRPASYPKEVGYCWISEATPRPSNQRANGMMQIDMPIGGIV